VAKKVAESRVSGGQGRRRVALKRWPLAPPKCVQAAIFDVPKQCRVQSAKHVLREGMVMGSNIFGIRVVPKIQRVSVMNNLHASQPGAADWVVESIVVNLQSSVTTALCGHKS
jgi:hypothetical protein